jgi:hypothetical protein
MRFQTLQTTAELQAFQALLHDVYVATLGWAFDPQNPSGLRVETTKEGQKLLRDNFESQGTVFGVLDGPRLVGGIRLLKPREGLLELEHYHRLPAPFTGQNLKKYEVNRMVVLPEYQQTTAAVLLLQGVAEFLTNRDCEVLFASLTEPEPAGLCTRLGFTPSESQKFKYSSRDLHPVRLHHLDCRIAGALETIVGMCERLRAA